MERFNEEGEQILSFIEVVCPKPRMNIIDAARCMLNDNRIIGNYDWPKDKILFQKEGEIIVIPGNTTWNPTMREMLSGNYYIIK